MRRAAVEESLQQPPPTAVATINPSDCRPPVTSLLAPKRIALLRTHLPSQPNPHSRVRDPLRAPSPAGSFLGGFRTPATVHLAPSFITGIRNPAQKRTHAVQQSPSLDHWNRRAISWPGGIGGTIRATRRRTSSGAIYARSRCISGGTQIKRV